MKLSEAIRVGSKLKPQAHGSLYVERRRWFGLFGPVERVASCALGAAFEAADCGSHIEEKQSDATKPFRGEATPVGTPVNVIDHPAEWFPILRATGTCPQCGTVDIVQKLIAHLNDVHKWEREHIALLVEQVEEHVSNANSVAPKTIEREWPQYLEAEN